MDSGWRFIKDYTQHRMGLWWYGTRVCVATTCSVGNSTYYKGSVALVETDSDVGYYEYFYVKKVDNLTEYKVFSSF